MRLIEDIVDEWTSRWGKSLEIAFAIDTETYQSVRDHSPQVTHNIGRNIEQILNLQAIWKNILKSIFVFYAVDFSINNFSSKQQCLRK